MEKLRCIYGEMLQKDGNKFSLKVVISQVRNSPKLLYCQGEKNEAWDIIFAQKDKDGAYLYIQIPKRDEDGKATGLLRQYVAKCGGEPAADHVGKGLELVCVPSKKAAAGWAVRIAKADQ